MKEHRVLEISVWNGKESGPLIKHLLSANMSLALSRKLDQRAYKKLPCFWLGFLLVSLMIVILFLSIFGAEEKVEVLS